MMDERRWKRFLDKRAKRLGCTVEETSRLDLLQHTIRSLNAEVDELRKDCITMSGNQPEKGAEAVTGVAPQKHPVEQVRDMLKGAGIHDPMEDLPIIPVALTPAPQPMSATDELITEIVHLAFDNRHLNSGEFRYRLKLLFEEHSPKAQPMSADAFWKQWCKETLGLVRRAILQGLPALYAQFAEAYAAHQHAALMQRNAELDRWLNDAATLLRSDLDSVGKAAAALIAERDRMVQEIIELSRERSELKAAWERSRKAHSRDVTALRRLQGGEPYETCPRCEGHCQIYDYDAMAPAAEDFSRSFDQDAYVIACPACQGSGRVPKLPAPPTAEPCKCTHLKARHNFKAVGECMDCGCTEYVAAEPAKEGK